MTIHLLFLYFLTKQKQQNKNKGGQNNSMKNWWFNSMLFKKELERKCGLNKSMDSLGPIENTGEIEDSNRKDATKNIQSGGGLDDSSYRNLCRLYGVKDIRSLFPNKPILVKDSNGDKYSIYFDFFDIAISILEIDNNYLFLNELDNWNNYINSCINSYLQSEICIDTSIVSDSDNCSDSYIYRYICGESRNNGEGEGSDDEREGSAGIRTPAQDSDLILEESSNDSDEQDSDLTLEESSNDIDGQDEDSSNDSDETDIYSKYSHLWVLCDNCYGLNYKRFLKEKMNICEHCEWHLKMNSSDRIDLLIDPDTWNPMDEDMVSLDPIEWDSSLFDEEDEKDRLDSSSFDEEDKPYKDPFGFDSSSFDEEDEKDRLDSSSFDSDEFEQEDEKNPFDSSSFDEEDEPYKDPFDFDKDPFGFDSSSFDEEDKKDRFDSSESNEDESNEDEFEEEDEPYKDRLDSYQTKTGLPEAVQTGIGELNGIPVAVGVMDFEFIGGSMGSVVGEKITRLIEYATNQFLPLIIVCASGGARMQEGSVSLMQMAKISSALYDYQSNKKLFYVSILASPTTGGVTASFGMLGDIIIAEPNAYIAFAGKRVIEELLKITVPEGLQETENLFDKGAFDLIVPRNLLKSVLTELFKLHGFFPLTKN
uniref:acetyl-CoA carboxylase carboxyltransferase beta subunit n=1 Tax=Hoya longifolia TaxID=945165 RepID=UPI0022F30BB9|nr:acetyl-CoA carboxylase carboxyltransferase beta subunit [Hoya longifolia]YP_010592138.1 acetyl-CoA carboxylase carboxyltransferase beta subunit [Hoya griffithii]WAB52007.1 acetyl-CoA carboxylase carboxyltransferase beta subunit [Hoya longifolia]WAB52583.1 acetyl-CoA carboxylase carboxyltransferase beta subunit [Hoya griffithii]